MTGAFLALESPAAAAGGGRLTPGKRRSPLLDRHAEKCLSRSLDFLRCSRLSTRSTLPTPRPATSRVAKPPRGGVVKNSRRTMSLSGGDNDVSEV
jgi:hypothetical protein